MRPDPLEIRARLRSARLMLLFTPELCGARDPLEALEAACESCDVIQIRPKPLGPRARGLAPCEARATFEWCRRALALDARRRHGTLVTVDDRVDVARALWDEGCAGAHVGPDDCPALIARDFLGRGPLLGVSTHSLDDIARAALLPIDYVGFGPIRATATKGYDEGLGTEAAWIASQALELPLFPIGGIDAACAGELARVGRAAVGSFVLSSVDPSGAARDLRRRLGPQP